MTSKGGPHGLHTTGSQAWVNKHGQYAEASASACAYCHGADYRGGPLSTATAARSFSVEGRRVAFTAGQQVGCYDCHAGPGGGGAAQPPVSSVIAQTRQSQSGR